MATISDLLRSIDRVRKDLEYVRALKKKWQEQKDRFPKIYEGIENQHRDFLRIIDRLQSFEIQGEVGDLVKNIEGAHRTAPGVPAEAGVGAPATKPSAEAPSGSATPSPTLRPEGGRAESTASPDAIPDVEPAEERLIQEDETAPEQAVNLEAMEQSPAESGGSSSEEEEGGTAADKDRMKEIGDRMRRAAAANKRRP